MKTRVGKIARLPKQIREELNRRLSDGERSKNLVAWLNGLPETQKVMQEQFGGAPISEPNLSHWKQGGYSEWLRHQDIRAQARWITEQGEDLSTDEGHNDLSESLAFLVTSELMMRVQALNDLSDPKERWRQFRQIARELSRVRRDDQRYRRNELERAKWESTLEPEEAAEEQPDAENTVESQPVELSAQSGIQPN